MSRMSRIVRRTGDLLIGAAMVLLAIWAIIALIGALS